MTGKCRSKRVAAQGACDARVHAACSTRPQLITALRLDDVVWSQAGDLFAEFRRQRMQRRFITGLQFELDFGDRCAAEFTVHLREYVALIDSGFNFRTVQMDMPQRSG